MDAGTLDTDACAHGVDAVIIALDGNLGTLTRDAGNGADHDETIMNLGHLLLKEAAQEVLAGSGDNNLGIIVGVVHLLDDGPYDITLAVDVGRNLLILGKEQFVLLFVKQENLTLPDLIDFTGNKLALEGFELVVDGILLQVEDFAG